MSSTQHLTQLASLSVLIGVLLTMPGMARPENDPCGRDYPTFSATCSMPLMATGKMPRIQDQSPLAVPAALQPSTSDRQRIISNRGRE